MPERTPAESAGARSRIGFITIRNIIYFIINPHISIKRPKFASNKFSRLEKTKNRSEVSGVPIRYLKVKINKKSPLKGALILWNYK
jgi:hypothetical protein